MAFALRAMTLFLEAYRQSPPARRSKGGSSRCSMLPPRGPEIWKQTSFFGLTIVEPWAIAARRSAFFDVGSDGTKRYEARSALLEQTVPFRAWSWGCPAQ